MVLKVGQILTIERLSEIIADYMDEGKWLRIKNLKVIIVKEITIKPIKIKFRRFKKCQK